MMAADPVVTRVPGPSVHERMVAILAALPPIGKDQENKQQGFMFRGHDDVLNALNPLLAAHGVFIVPDVLERVTAQRTTSKGSVMFEVNLHVRFRFYGAEGDYVEGSTWGEGTDMGDKATNKAMTMAFKNVLNQAFSISNKETVDADLETPEETPFVVPAKAQEKLNQRLDAPFTAPNPVPARDEQVEKLKALSKELHEAALLTRAEVESELALFGVGAFRELTADEADALYLKLERLQKNASAAA